jgi:putative ABC transport system substrate-binding protein
MTARRHFLVTLGALAAGPALAQAPRAPRRIGFLTMRAKHGPPDDALIAGLRDLGYVVGRDVTIDYRFANNDPVRMRAMAAELAQLRCDVIVGATVYAIRAAMQAAPSTPIVIAAAGDPVGSGLVADLRRPGGNVTGLTLQSTLLAAKRLELMREIVPGATRFAMLGMSEPDQVPDRRVAALMHAELERAAQRFRASVVARSIAAPAEVSATFAAYRDERVQALIVQVTPLSIEHRAAIIEAAARARMPAMYELRMFVDDGGLVAYGPDLQDMYRRAAGYVDRILRGAKPGELAIEQPSKFELALNERTATSLGLKLPASLLVRADEVIR